MAKGTRVSDREREAIIAAFDTDKSCRQLATEFERSPSTISAIARDVGHEFGRSNLARAQAAKAAYDDERRQQLRLDTADNAQRVLAQMFEPATIFNFGGRDNTYNERAVEKPTYRDQRDIAQTYKTLMTVVFEFDKREHGEPDDALFDVLSRAIESQANDYSPAGDDAPAEGEAGLEHPAS